MKIRLLVAAATMLTAIFVLCSRDMPVMPGENTTVVYPGPGKFSISRVQNLSKKSAGSLPQTDDHVGFDLGSVKASENYHFLLYNVGFSAVTNISIAFADSHFIAFPAHMDTLFPGIDIGLLPIVTVNAEHGTALTGVGYRPLLPKGNDTAVLRITGTTRTQSGKDSTLILDAAMAVKALVMDIEIRDTGGLVPLGSPGGRARGDFPEGISDMPFYSVSGCTVAVKNTGNVPITLKVWPEIASINDTSYGAAASFTIPAGDSAFVPRKSGRQVLCIDGNNTISDQVKLPLSPNGTCYFCLRGDASCVSSTDTSVDVNSFYTLFYMTTTACPNARCRFFLIDNSLVFWELAGKENCKYVTAGGRIYRLYGKTPDKLLCSYQGETGSFWTVEHYETKAAHGMLDTIRANLSDSELGLGKNHDVVLIIQ
jgi:hypothetical protein